MDVVKEREISLPEAKEIISKRAKDKNMAYEQKITKEYFEKIPVLSRAKAEKMQEELSQISSLKPGQAAEIINIMPETMEEVMLLFGKESLQKEETDKIIEIVRKFKKA